MRTRIEPLPLDRLPLSGRITLEKNILEYATALSGTGVEVSDEVYAGIRKHLSDAQVIELTHAILRGADRARFNRALDTEDDDIPEGAYCLVRDAQEGRSSEGLP